MIAAIEHGIGIEFAQPGELPLGQLAGGGNATLGQGVGGAAACKIVPHLAVAHAAHAGHVGV